MKASLLLELPAVDFKMENKMVSDSEVHVHHCLHPGSHSSLWVSFVVYIE